MKLSRHSRVFENIRKNPEKCNISLLASQKLLFVDYGILREKEKYIGCLVIGYPLRMYFCFVSDKNVWFC